MAACTKSRGEVNLVRYMLVPVLTLISLSASAVLTRQELNSLIDANAHYVAGYLLCGQMDKATLLRSTTYQLLAAPEGIVIFEKKVDANVELMGGPTKSMRSEHCRRWERDDVAGKVQDTKEAISQIKTRGVPKK